MSNLSPQCLTGMPQKVSMLKDMHTTFPNLCILLFFQCNGPAVTGKQAYWMVINRGHFPLGDVHIQEFVSLLKGQLYPLKNKKKQQLWICMSYLEDTVPPQTAPEFFYCFLMPCVRRVPPQNKYSLPTSSQHHHIRVPAAP